MRVCQPDILNDSLCLFRSQNDLNLLQALRDTISSDILSWQKIVLLDVRHVLLLALVGCRAATLLLAISFANAGGEEDRLQGDTLRLELALDFLVNLIHLMSSKNIVTPEILFILSHDIHNATCGWIIFFRYHGEQGDLLDLFNVNFLTSIAVNDVIYALQVFLDHRDANKLVHFHKVLESETANLSRIELREDLVEGIVVSVHILVELSDPFLKLHPLVRLLLLELLRALDHRVLELFEADRVISSISLLHFDQAIDFIHSKTSFQSLQTRGELLLVEASGTTLRFLLPPLVE